MKEEGVIKFKCIHIEAQAPDPELIHELNEWRNKLFDLGLIGQTPEGIGYGNMSIRKERGFIITGSGTGGIKNLDAKNYVEVTGHSIPGNLVECRGPLMASSESLTHAVIYDTMHAAGAVFHVHHKELWEKLLASQPSTPADTPYGTPEMAEATRKLITNFTDKSQGIFAMAGHEDGVVCYAMNPTSAGELLLKHFNK